MLKVVSFRTWGEFAAFRDPSVTSNQTAYYIPSKTAVIGMIGAILGIERGHGINENYSNSYRQLFEKTRIGVELESAPEKVAFFTNHRSLKEAKTKPFKTELIFRPRYRIFVSSDNETNQKVFDTISRGNYVYPPYLGHAYCHATLSDPVVHEANEYSGTTYHTTCVILDESEPFDGSFELQADPDTNNSSLIIERHLHHYVENGELKARVLKYWIPVGGSSFKITMSKIPKLSKIVKLDNNSIVSLY